MRLSSSRKRKLLIALGVTVSMGLLADQVLLHVLIDDGKLFGGRVAPYDPPLFSAGQEAALARLKVSLETGKTLDSLFDPELGWCSPQSKERHGATFDRRGARVGPAPVPDERTPGVQRVVALGCSFTLGHEVGDAEAWPYLLDKDNAALELINLGVNAYGIDQALLRYRRDGEATRADEVWLGWLPPASLRLGSMYRQALRHWSGPLAFKPRFRMRGDELELIPNPAGSPADLYRLLTTQEDFLDAVGEDDLWIKRTRASWAPLGSSWLHSFGLGRAWLTFTGKSERDPIPWLADDDSEIRQLVGPIVAALEEQVERHGARLRVLVLPDNDMLRYRQDHGRGYWEGLADEMRASGVEVIDLVEACLEAGMLDDPESWMPGSHYSPKGNAIIAEALARATVD